MGVALTEYRDAAAVELAKAARGSVLTGLSQVDAPPFMLNGPTDVASAHYISGYWLAAASRIAQSRGLRSSPLTAGAAKSITKAGTSAINPLQVMGFGHGTDVLSAILKEAQDLAAGSGVADVGAILSRLRAPSEIAESKRELGTKTWLDVFIPTGARRVLGAASVLVLLAAVGGGLYFTRDLWMPTKGRKRRRNGRMPLASRVARIGVGTVLGSLGALGWAGPQAAEPVSTLVGLPMSLAGLFILATGVSGDEALGRKLRKELF